MRLIHAVLAVFVLYSGAACVEKGPKDKGKKIPQEYIEENLLSISPAIKNPVNADLGGKVVYLGNDVETDTIAPGGKVTITHYWKVTSAPGKDWRVFAHVIGASSKDWMNVDYTDMRQGYPPAKWKAGDIIRDVQKFALKKDWTSPFAQVSVGLYRKGGRAITDRMPVVSGPKDDQSRVKAFRFKVALGANAKTIETSAPSGYVVRRATGPITIDGKADEPDWKSAPKSPKFVDAEGGPAMERDTHARLLYDDQNLYVFVESIDDDVWSQYKERDGDLWKEDVIEVFIDADRNRRGYVELQVNPNNTHLDYWFSSTRRVPPDKAFDAKMKSAVHVMGSADKRGDKDVGWNVEIAIPLESVKGGDPNMRVQLPPPLGARWRLNIIRGDRPPAKGAKLRAASWGQVPYSDFHALHRMIEVTFGDAKGQVKGAPIARPPAPRGAGLFPSSPLARPQPPAKPGSTAKPAPTAGPTTKPGPTAKPAPKAAPKPAPKPAPGKQPIPVPRKAAPK